MHNFTKKYFFAIVFLGVSLFAVPAAEAIVFQSQPVGIQVGDSGTLVDETAENLFYGIVNGSSINGSLIKLEVGSGSQVYRIDTAGNVTATSFAGSGASLTALNATQLTSGTIPLARLSGITTTEIQNGTLLFADWASNSCSTNYIPKWNGSAWACAVDATGTSLSAGSNIDPTSLSAGTIAVVSSPSFSGLTITGDTATVNSKNILRSLDDIQATSAGNIDLIAGDGINFTPGTNAITISATAQSGYVRSPGTMNWYAARDYCRGLGGHLAVVGNSTQNAEITALGGGWIGLNDIVSENNFRWLDDDPSSSYSTLGYTNWGGGEPNNDGGNEDCTTGGSSWNDANCSGSTYALCSL